MTETVFILIGIEDHEEETGYMNVLGIYVNLENALEDIKHYEQDKKNYWCSECDTGWDDLDNLTEAQFKERKCSDPECNGRLEYCPETYCEFEINKYQIFSESVYHKKDKFGIEYSDFHINESEVYRCKYNDKTKEIDQWYLEKKLVSRSANDSILIDNFKKKIINCEEND